MIYLVRQSSGEQRGALGPGATPGRGGRPVNVNDADRDLFWLRDFRGEIARAGQFWWDSGTWLPPCAAERAGFMAILAALWSTRLGAMQRSPTPAEPTSTTHPIASLLWPLAGCGRPVHAENLMLDFRPDAEPRASRTGEDTWVQHHDNQKRVLDTFFSAIRSEESLVFLCAKRTPLTDDPNCVIVGKGRIPTVGEAVPLARKECPDRCHAKLAGEPFEAVCRQPIRVQDRSRHLQ